MLFEVLQKDALVVVFYTEHISCIPDDDELKLLRQAGYRFRINNRIVDKEKIVTLAHNLKATGPIKTTE